MVAWISENWRYFTVAGLAGIIGYSIAGTQIEPVSVKIQTETKIQEKIVTQLVTKNTCIGTVITKPDGTTETTIVANQDNQQTLDQHKAAENTQNLTINPSNSSRRYGLGVNIHMPVNEVPTSLGLSNFSLSLSIPLGDRIRIVGGYRFDKTISIGVQYEL